MYDLAVIGAGPVGSFLASRCASGMEVLVLEEDESAGSKACSGLVSERFMDMLPREVRNAEGLVQHRVRGADVHFMGKALGFRKSGTAAYVLDRGMLDMLMARHAVSCGAQVRYGERVLGAREKPDCVALRTQKHEFMAGTAAGCDGARSVVAAAMGAAPAEVVNGLILYEEKEARGDSVGMWFDKSLVKDGFFWKIPRGATTEYGCMGKGLGFGMLSKFFGLQGVEGLRRDAAPIPLGPPERTVSEKMLLVGDAAAQTKPWSGGGLAYGFIAAGCAREALLKGDGLGSYEASWRKILMKDIHGGLMLREFYRDLDLDGLSSVIDRLESAGSRGEGIDFDFPLSSIAGGLPDV